ncbi:hypothetical protein PSQ90_04370 [Devosia rhodophyticola]|uniref:O-antigen ligase domain-containing protein n=1 Tax=Devosia rhodophyticola TaxID=3026423 RepID=A0ABY7Z0N4_9HYPH|nr:hypothetical protein [Devosia rhodophyticola]WDR06699.1 hypothetical protein PSQ90_04370 [Devosia rhodophyticola]
MVAGSCGALAFRKTWIIAPLFLFVAFWINRRAETVIIISSIIAIFIVRFPQSEQLKFKLLKLISCFAIFFLLAFPLHNEANVYAWRALFNTSVAVRLQLIFDGLSGIDGTLAKSKLTAEAQAGPADASLENLIGVVSGNGLGSFAKQYGDFKYPHNIAVEIYYETGPVAFFVFFAALLFATIFIAVSTARSKNIKRNWVALSFLAAGIFFVSMKAGDITSLGRVFFFLVFAVATTNDLVKNTSKIS